MFTKERRNTQHNDTQHNNTRDNGTTQQYKNAILSINELDAYAGCRYADCHSC
jgi:hypothetical protein